ncbi:tRNA(Ile)-lysidine synthase [[Leptolyngbya] sp. PCC 7376]|uniref:tRNA lysidine(34) synthetase TilS n=1 Tax=[Leptolyngbya] sp. PCC 7376 TaxID=111781 RepID=UPI00029EF82D|nr:tRNA lysidine(34) synthetase TilS [[Leptolyngbya] sp. PCC 7376]AFY38400.1 tRNA(Ile)-lysidine synthase [[Leptolyngbya] sp. PCC 7376]
MNWSLLHARVHQHLKETQLLPTGQRILVAVSGGQDSLCLGQLLLDLSRRWQWRLAIAHCNHGWSGDEAIADHVCRIAVTWQLPFFLCAAETPIKETEAAARQWRYQELGAVAITEQFSIVVTGHTLSDRAETLLFNLARGSGLGGLGALTERRSLTSEVSLVRPLLTVHRDETAAFCTDFNLPIYEDTYNHNLRFSRNRLRQQVLPELKVINSQAEQHLAQTAIISQAENDYLEAIAAEHFAKYFAADLSLQRLPLRQIHPALQRRILKQYLIQLLPKQPSFQQIEACRKLIYAPNRSQTSSFSGDIKFIVNAEYIVPLDKMKK